MIQVYKGMKRPLFSDAKMQMEFKIPENYPERRAFPCCPCGRYFQTLKDQEIMEHWLKGHFDVPVYEDVEIQPAAQRADYCFWEKQTFLIYHVLGKTIRFFNSNISGPVEWSNFNGLFETQKFFVRCVDIMEKCKYEFCRDAILDIGIGAKHFWNSPLALARKGKDRFHVEFGLALEISQQFPLHLNLEYKGNGDRIAGASCCLTVALYGVLERPLQ